MLRLVILNCVLVASQAFFFPPAAGRGGCGCGSPTPACPPPAVTPCRAPPPPPPCPPVQSCGGGGAYAAPPQAPIYQSFGGNQGYAHAPQVSLPSLSLPIGGTYQQAIGPVGNPIGNFNGGGYKIPQQTFVPQPQEPQQVHYIPEVPVAVRAQQYQEQVPQISQEYPVKQEKQEHQNQEEEAAYEDVGSNAANDEIQKTYPEGETNQEVNPNNSYDNTAKAAAALTHTADLKCNSKILRNLIHENIHENTSTAKRQIQAKAAAEIGGRIDVICSSGVFSYIVNTELYCEAEKNGVTCLAFRQAS